MNPLIGVTRQEEESTWIISKTLAELNESPNVRSPHTPCLCDFPMDDWVTSSAFLSRVEFIYQFCLSQSI